MTDRRMDKRAEKKTDRMNDRKAMTDYTSENNSECNLPVEGPDLDTLLAQLAAATSAVSAPSAVRQRLFAEAGLETLLDQPSRARPAFALTLASVLSAVFLIGAVGAGTSLLLGRTKFSPALSSAVHAALRSVGLSKTLPQAAALPASGDPTADLLAPGDSNSSPAFENGNSGLSTNVFALPLSDPAIANGTETTVRVSVPTSQLIAWGVPPLANGPDDEVSADLLLGDDGLPRAIRILPASTTTTSSAPEENYP
jgi:hypothetical protein